MESWDKSKKLKNELLLKASSIEDNSRRILFILSYLGPQRFTQLIKYSNLSRSTVSNHLKSHREKGNVELKLIPDKKTNKMYRHYIITENGVEKLGETPLKLKDEVYIINEFKGNVKRLDNLIRFYKEIGLHNRFIIQIVRIVSKIGENFFKLQHDRDLCMSLFYIFYNSILGQGKFAKTYWHFTLATSQAFSGYKLDLDHFCEAFQVPREAINYLAKHKLITNEFGFYLIKRGKSDFFFHEEDLLGTTTLRLIRDKLIDEIIHIQEGIYEKTYNLDVLAKEITNQLKEMGLIWKAIQSQFQLLVLNLIIKNAIEIGFLDLEREILMEGVAQSEMLILSNEGKQLKEAILSGGRLEVNLNRLSEI